MAEIRLEMQSSDPELTGRTISPEDIMSVSKGVDYYTYVSGPPFSILVTAPGFQNTCGPANNFVKQNLQVDSSNISGTINYTGTLSWQVLSNGTWVGEGTGTGAGSVQINSLTGAASGGTMSSMMQGVSWVGSNYLACYGFYAAASGLLGPLTNQDQMYVYVTDNYSNWMGDLVNQYPQVRNCAFQQFALPGAHDAGMFSLEMIQEIMTSSYAGAFATGVASFLGGSIAPSMMQRAIINSAVTQKDDITTMLELGIRYFDFRPGTLLPAFSDVSPGIRYHQHNFIPGYAYAAFLADVLRWLNANSSEIVVVSANTQGFSSPSMIPSAQDLDADLASAFSIADLTSNAISTGDKSSLNQTIGQLLASNTRLIFLNQISDPPETVKCDSYSDAAYATLTPGPIIAALAGMTAAHQAGADYTVLQMQGTATAAIGAKGWISTGSSASDASSPLMATKASFDSAINPWLMENVSKNLSNSQLVVFLNDFADNCMVNTAITVTKQRMGLL